MSDTSVFRLAGAAVVLVSLFIAIYYRGRAKLRQKRSGRSSQRVSNPLSLRLAGVAHLLVVVSFLATPQLLSWSYYTAPNWLRWTGVAGAAVSSLLAGWVLSALGDNTPLAQAGGDDTSPRRRVIPVCPAIVELELLHGP